MPDRTVATQYHVLTVILIELFVLSCLNCFCHFIFCISYRYRLMYYYYYYCNYVGEQSGLLCQITAEIRSRPERNILI